LYVRHVAFKQDRHVRSRKICEAAQSEALPIIKRVPRLLCAIGQRMTRQKACELTKRPQHDRVAARKSTILLVDHNAAQHRNSGIGSRTRTTLYPTNNARRRRGSSTRPFSVRQADHVIVRVKLGGPKGLPAMFAPIRQTAFWPLEGTPSRSDSGDRAARMSR